MKTIAVPAAADGRPKITNQMKAECIGKFSIEVEHTCPICYEGEPSESCEVCAGEVEFTVKHQIPWEIMKAIYKMMAAVAMQSAE